ncbi:hypothetical protein AS590_05935 [Prescottella equi]|nr:hypothetical protein AS590_05935 [Prescottella equi]
MNSSSATYFSDRESGPVPRDRDELTDSTRDGLAGYVSVRIGANWLADEFPDQCLDGNQICGTDTNGLGALIEALVPGVKWPLRASAKLSDAQIFDLLEFMANRVSKPSERDFHSYGKHYHLTFDRETGFFEFRREVNEILARGGANYEMSESGKILRIGAAPVRALISRLQPNTGDPALDELINYATVLYTSKNPAERQTALEKLWDGYAHLKTLMGTGKKPARIEALLAAIEPVELRERIDTEMRELTEIGNQFRIRHAETDAIPVEDSARDYLFTRMGSMLAFLLERNGFMTLQDD